MSRLRFPAVVLSLVFMACCSTALFAEAQEYRFYQSNPFGQKIREVEALRSDEFEYILLENVAGSFVERILVASGVKKKRWELELFPGGSVKSVFEFHYTSDSEEAVPFSRERYDITGRLVEEVAFSFEGIDRTRYYQYYGNRIQSVDVKNASAELLYTDLYLYSADGGLQRIVRTAEAEVISSSEYRTRDGRLVEEWHGSEGSGMLIRYDDSGRIRERELWEDEVLAEMESFRYNSDGFLRQVVKEDFRKNSVIKSEYSPQGKLLLTEQQSDGEVEEQIFYEYSGDRLQRQRRLSPGVSEIIEYEYSGSTRIESIFGGKVLERKLFFEDDEFYLEEVYKDGELVLKLYYENGLVVEEEVFYQGKRVNVAGESDEE